MANAVMELIGNDQRHPPAKRMKWIRRPQSRVPDSGHHEVASDGGGEHWAVIASLIETCKLNGVEPYAYLADVISKIVNGHPNSRINELLPWAYPAAQSLKDVA